MNNHNIEKLAETLQKLPGIGPRQAKRMVFAILEKEGDFAKNLCDLISELSAKIKRCKHCFYAFERETKEQENICPLCKDTSRDIATLLIVEKEIDLENIEKSGCYNGRYFVLGGVLSLFNKNNDLKKIRMRELFYRVKNDINTIKETAIALSATKEGDATIMYINKILEPIAKNSNLKITALGKGLSSGAEIEYSDKDTIKNAFLNRK